MAPAGALCFSWVRLVLFPVSHRFYKKAGFYDNRCVSGDGGGIDNNGGDLKWDYIDLVVLSASERSTIDGMLRRCMGFSCRAICFAQPNTVVLSHFLRYS